MRAHLVAAVLVVLSGALGCPGPKTGVAPMTMIVYAEPSIFPMNVGEADRDISLDSTGQGLFKIFEIVFGTNTGVPPAALANPHINWGAGWPWNPTTVGNTSYAFVGQTLADFAARNGGGVFDGPSGMQASELNSCIVFKTSIISHAGEQRTYGQPPKVVTVTLTKQVLGWWTAWTIAHEIGWHKIGGYQVHPVDGTVHLGFNNPDLIFPANLCWTGIFPTPAFPNEVTRKWQLQLAYLLP